MYVLDMSEPTIEAVVRNLKKWLPNHRPILTCVGVQQLALEGMRIEIEVSAHDEEGAALAKAKSEK